MCGSGETCTGCPADCGTCSGCGNGICSPTETCSSCPADCGTCVCTNGQTQACQNPNSIGTCNGTETCNNNHWVNCSAPTPVEEICDDAIDNDCDTQIDEGCFSRLKVLWIPYTTDAQKTSQWLHQTRQNGFSGVIGTFNYLNGSIMSPSLQNFASSSQQEGLGLIPKFTFDYQWVRDGMILDNVQEFKALYYNGTELVDSNLIAPLNSTYWTALTDKLVQLANRSKTTMPSLRGVIFDLELYDHYDLVYTYFTRDSSFDTETFRDFVNANNLGSLDPPVSQERRFERYSFLTNHHWLDAYHQFVATTAEQRARDMANQVHAVNPDFFIGMYPSPGWRFPYNSPPQSIYMWPLFF